MYKYVNKRCPKTYRVKKMSGAGGMVSVWFVTHLCRCDIGHLGPCDFTPGKRTGAQRG